VIKRLETITIAKSGLSLRRGRRFACGLRFSDENDPDRDRGCDFDPCHNAGRSPCCDRGSPGDSNPDLGNRQAALHRECPRSSNAPEPIAISIVSAYPGISWARAWRSVRCVPTNIHPKLRCSGQSTSKPSPPATTAAPSIKLRMLLIYPPSPSAVSPIQAGAAPASFQWRHV